MSRKARPTIQVFAGIELFRDLSDRALHRIADMARVRRLPKRTRVFSQGDGDVRMHAVLAGAVSVVQVGSDGAQVVTRVAGAGQMLETVAMFTDKRYPADAVAMCDTVEASWNEADFLALMGAYPRIALNLIRVISAGLQEMEERVWELATRNVESRIARTVLRLARNNGSATPAGISIGVPLRRKDVADIAGTTLHTASRVLTSWEKAGVIGNHSRVLTIKRLAELESKIVD